MGYTIGYVHVIDEASLLAPLVLQIIYHISIAVRWPSGASPPPTRSTALSSSPLLRCAISAVNSCDSCDGPHLLPWTGTPAQRPAIMS